MLQREKKSLLKLLSSNKKKSRPSPPSSPTLEAEQAAAAGEVLHGAMGHDTSPPSCSVSCLESESAAASASSPSSSSSVPESSHWKSSPLDGCAPIAPPPRQPCSSLVSQHHDARPIICERYTDFKICSFMLSCSSVPLIESVTPYLCRDLSAVIVAARIADRLCLWLSSPGTGWWYRILPRARLSWNSRRATLCSFTGRGKTAGSKEHCRGTARPDCSLAAL